MKEVVSIFLQTSDDSYLLQLRDKDNSILYPNHWSFFGGGIEKKEKVYDALIREIYEELLWKPKKVLFYKKTKNLKYKCNIFYYLIKCDVENSYLILNEGQDMNWFLPNETKKILTTPSNLSEMLLDKKIKEKIKLL